MPPAQAITKVKSPVLSPFIRLPIELVNIIFTLASETSRKACLDLCLVASWARHIALPHLFRTILASDHIVKFHKYLVQPPYIPFNSDINAASLVENVCMSPRGRETTTSVLDVFQNCHNIIHIAVTIPCFYKLVYSTSSALITEEEPKISGSALDNNRDLHLTLLGAPSFTREEIELFHSDASVRSPLYDRVTHVRVETDSPGALHQIAHFSRLSHLSLPYDKSLGQIAQYLDDFTNLEMFVVAGVKRPRQQARWKKLQDWVRVTRQKDKRVFFVEIPAMDMQTQWAEEMMGGDSIWSRAFRYTTQLDAEEAKKVAEEPESQSTASQEVKPRRSRRNVP